MVMLFVVCFMHEHTNCAGRHARMVLPNQRDTLVIVLVRSM